MRWYGRCSFRASPARASTASKRRRTRASSICRARLQRPSSWSVAFSTAMDQGQLIASTGRSESVAIVPESTVDRAAAAIEHSRLTVEERGLLVAAAATIEDAGSALTVTPDAPLAPGTYYLLVAARLRDPAGHRLAEALRYRYSVAAPRAQVALVAPPPGTTAPANLSRARVSVASGAGTLALVGAKGVVASIPIGAPGPFELPLCRPSAKTCAPLEPGQSYSLALDGKAIEGTSFTVARAETASAPLDSPRRSVRPPRARRPSRASASRPCA